jgi:hypothetical protein
VEIPSTFRDYQIYCNNASGSAGIATDTPIVGTGSLRFWRVGSTAPCFNVVRTVPPHRFLSGLGYLTCCQRVTQQSYLDMGYYCCATQENMCAEGLVNVHAYAGGFTWLSSGSVAQTFLTDFLFGFNHGSGTGVLPSGTLYGPAYGVALGMPVTMVLDWAYSPLFSGVRVRMWAGTGTSLPLHGAAAAPILQQVFPLSVAPVPMAEGEFCRIQRFDATNEGYVDNVGRFPALLI